MTIAPLPCSTKPRPAARESASTHCRLTWSTRSASSALTSSTAPRATTPAEFTRTSSRPKAAAADWIARSQSAASACSRSTWTSALRRPSASTCGARLGGIAPVDVDDVAARLGQRERGRLADAARRAGHARDVAVEAKAVEDAGHRARLPSAGATAVRLRDAPAERRPARALRAHARRAGGRAAGLCDLAARDHRSRCHRDERERTPHRRPRDRRSPRRDTRHRAERQRGRARRPPMRTRWRTCGA